MTALAMPSDVSFAVSCRDWHPANVRRVRQAIEVSLRNEAIRDAYRNRGDEDPGTCLERLADAHALSPDTIQRIVFPR